MALKTGHFLLGTEFDETVDRSLVGKFVDASKDLGNNLIALLTDRDADWHGLEIFYNEVFYPYMVGGLLPGAIAGTVAYLLSLPLIKAYQKRRRSRIKAKFNAIRQKAERGE